MRCTDCPGGCLHGCRYPVTSESTTEPEPGSFGAGYREGRGDVLYALARGHQWAFDLFRDEAEAAAQSDHNLTTAYEKSG
jgi:hypothetical protein